MNIFCQIWELLFPRKCIFCRKLLSKEETDLCHTCRATAPEFTKSKRRILFVAQWTAIWYYKGDIRSSIHRFKFHNYRIYGEIYAKHLALKLQDSEIPDNVDLLTWLPTSPSRRLKRGYDQSEILAKSLGKELHIPVIKALRRVRNSPPQSALQTADQRRANILNAYKPYKPSDFAGRRILLIDDIITTGSTASEAAKTLLVGGAKEVYLAAIAAASHDKNK